jgi:hypothetical protein
MPASDQEDIKNLKKTLGGVAGGVTNNPLGEQAGEATDRLTSPLTGRFLFCSASGEPGLGHHGELLEDCIRACIHDGIQVEGYGREEGQKDGMTT